MRSRSLVFGEEVGDDDATDETSVDAESCEFADIVDVYDSSASLWDEEPEDTDVDALR